MGEVLFSALAPSLTFSESLLYGLDLFSEGCQNTVELMF